MNTLQEEIRAFLAKNKMSQNDFAAYVGKHQNTVTNWLKTGNIPKSVEGLLKSKMEEYGSSTKIGSLEPLNKFILPGLIPINLITSDQVNSGEKSAEGNVVVVEVKLVRKDAYVSYLANWQDAGFIHTLPTKITMVKNYEKDATYRAFEVNGSGMDCDKKYAIEEGDNVTCINVPKDLWSTKLHIKQHREWVVVYDEGIIVAHIFNHDPEAGLISCRFYNDDKSFFPDIEIELSKVAELFYVISVEKIR